MSSGGRRCVDLIVALSSLQAPTSEIIARTRPDLFDLAVALFAALAGIFAIIRRIDAASA